MIETLLSATKTRPRETAQVPAASTLPHRHRSIVPRKPPRGNPKPVVSTPRNVFSNWRNRSPWTFPTPILERSGNTADPLVRSPGGESHSARRDGPFSAVISSRWRGTLPDREGLWTGDNPDRDLFTTDRVIQLVATLFVRSTSPKRQVGRRWPDPGFADRVSHDFYGCRQSSSRAYDHVGEWRARYRAFMHNDPSFSLSPLQLATTFYQSLSDVAKREVRAGMLREYRDTHS
ncbi:BZ3501_MvSof-1269-A2-R1_C53g00288 [Microbotryum saponariae]|nr:BZ3501_MvSof-1269-A2-R1_C53g00288 [Microbotryum saponariae]